VLVNYIEFFSKDNLAVIVTCITDKGWTVTRITKEFPSKKWNYRSIIRFPDNDFIFIQDSTPSHHAKATQEFFRHNTPDFISPQKWTPHSPDLNPLDYSIWDILQGLFYEGRREPFANLEDLDTVISDKWHDVDDQTVRKAIL